MAKNLRRGFPVRVQLALADARDDAELRALLRDNPMPGDIEVTFEREPSFFETCKVRGVCQTVVGRDTVRNRIIGLGTRSVAMGFVNGRAIPLGHLADLRLEAEYRGGLLVARAYRFLRALHADGATRLYTTMIFATNDTALRTIASGRAGLPAYHDMGVFHCPGINICRRKPPSPSHCEIVTGTRELLPQIVDCLNRNNARKQFAPHHEVRDFEQQRWPGFDSSNFRVALDHGRVVGVVGRWDQRRFKQTRIIRYQGARRWAVSASNIVRALTALPPYPRAGAAAACFHVSFVAIDGDDLRVFQALLRCVYNESVGTEFLYAVIGLHERDGLRSALADYSLTPFAGRLFCVCFEDGDEAFRALDGRVPYVEAGTL